MFHHQHKGMYSTKKMESHSYIKDNNYRVFSLLGHDTDPCALATV